MTAENNKSSYIEGDLRVRWAYILFFALWIATALLLKPMAETEIDNIRSMASVTPEAAIDALDNVAIIYLIIPMSAFLMLHGSYYSWLGFGTLKAGVYPPPSAKMPFRTKIQTGTKAKIVAFGCIFAGLCNFTVIALLLTMRNLMINFVQMTINVAGG
jgi:hypothetical protein